jgi:hypothetical protein
MLNRRVLSRSVLRHLVDPLLAARAFRRANLLQWIWIARKIINFGNEKVICREFKQLL